MPRLLIATFNIPCSGAGTFVLLVFGQSPTGTNREVYGINVDSAGNQDQYGGASEFDVSISIDNGMATVKVFTTSASQYFNRFRCCFIPGNPFTEDG